NNATCSASPSRPTSSAAMASRLAAAAALAKARSKCVLPLPPGPQRKTKPSPPASASRRAFTAAPLFHGQKFSGVGDGGGASSSNSCCIRLEFCSQHVTLSASPSLGQQEADHLPRRRGGHRRGRRPGRGDQAFREEDDAPGGASGHRR